MKKILSVGLTLVLISAIIALGLFVVWGIASVFVVRYLFKSNGKYESYKDFLKEGKNIAVVGAAVVLFIVIPVGYMKNSNEYKQEQKIKQEQQDKLESEKKAELEQKQKEKQTQRERNNILNAKSRLEKEKKQGKDIYEGIVLTDEEIEKYNITEAEVSKFNEDVEKAIIEIEDNNMVKKYKEEARKHVSKNVDDSRPVVSYAKYSFNQDKTICTIKGTYRGKNKYGVDIRGEYVIDFDTSSGEMVNEFIGNEKVINQ